jgi:diaminopimelate epimerase
VKKIHFYKYQGTGNDFILIDNRSGGTAWLNTGIISQLCDRRFGIGADGLILLENSGVADFKMIYYNSDGKQSSMCGNGGRCVVAFARFLGIAGNIQAFEAIDGMHNARILDGDANQMMVTLQMNDVKYSVKKNGAYIMDTGSPHYVTFCRDVSQLDIMAEGRNVRNSPEYKEKGINVNFVDAQENKFHMRTYERGVEAETYSCGTGTVATALALDQEGLLKEKDKAVLLTPGGKLEVTFKKGSGGYTDIWLTGPAVQVFEGIYDMNET